MIDDDDNPEQQDIPGVRPKPIAAIERAARAFVAAKEEQKKAKEKSDTKSLALAKALKDADLTVYASKAFSIQLDNTEKVKVKNLGGASPGSKDDDDL